jgi:hypothetical protein
MAGGKLSDKIGFYKVMVLVCSPVEFSFLLCNTLQLWGLCIGMFSIMTLADMFRPAMFVSLATYAKPK